MSAAFLSVFPVLGMVLLMILGPAFWARQSAHADAADGSRANGRVALVGIPGLRWSDVSEHGTPTLWRLTREGSAGALSVRTTRVNTCPADGWLTVSAGQRARFAHGECALAPVPSVSGVSASAPDWAQIRNDNAGTSYEAQTGLLGDAVHRAGGCTMAVGPGAVLGAADGGGRVDVYAPSPRQVPAGGWSRCALTAVEIDDIHRAHIRTGVDAEGSSIPIRRTARAEAATAADRQLAAVLGALPTGTTLLVAGLSDTGGVPHLHVALAGGAGFGPAYLTSNATRQPGIVTLTDVTATTLKALGLPQPKQAVGSAWRAEPTEATVADKVHDLDDEDVAAQAIRRVQPAFFIVLFGGQLLLYGLATVALRRRWGTSDRREDPPNTSAETEASPVQGAEETRRSLNGAAGSEASSMLDETAEDGQSGQEASGARQERPVDKATEGGPSGREASGTRPGRSPDAGSRYAARQRILAGTRVIALVGAATPVASFLANLLPWWRSEHPLPALILTVVAWITAITALALAGPWRRSLVGAGLVIAAITALVLAVDVMTGSRLQLNSLMGYTALVAGRFYGFGNQAFALFAVAALLTAAWLAERPLRAGRERAAVAVVTAIAVAAVAIDGWPSWGSDFGGVIAMVPAFAVLGLLISGRRVSAVRLGLFCVAGAVVVLAIAFADSLRADPSHLGRFWDDLVGGEAGGVIARKAGAMLRSLGYWPFTVAVVAALCFLFFVLAKPLQWRAALLERAYHRSRTLRPALLSALTLAIAGMLVNDSGVVIPAIAFSLAIPLTLAASVRALELDETTDGGSTSPPPMPRPRSAATG
ncbi:hypothetical protein [Thermomonospora echinospora]|uniref:hypothetical protein n=1 Tax=Thermomonospora echinospora TaxID=1992 RepID=UPI001F455318|nr:hypothetical protein [Thermomonospora echinospora]